MTNFDCIKDLHLPAGQFTIFGSSVLSVRNIRASDDIDILATQELRESLSKQYPDKVKNKGYDAIEIGNIEIMKDWIHLYGKEKEIIDTAEIIEGLPFARLKYFKLRKEAMGREKDKKDLELLANYEKKLKETNIDF